MDQWEKQQIKSEKREEREFKKVERMIERKEKKALGKWLRDWSKGKIKW